MRTSSRREGLRCWHLLCRVCAIGGGGSVLLRRLNIGGIINCLDPGGFGAVTIDKSIMIDLIVRR